MKSMPLHAGNVNMRGRKTVRMRCGCCVCRDLRSKEARRLAIREMAESARQSRDLGPAA